MDNFDGGLDEIQDRFDLKIPPHPQLFAFCPFLGVPILFLRHDKKPLKYSLQNLQLVFMMRPFESLILSSTQAGTFFIFFCLFWFWF